MEQQTTGKMPPLELARLKAAAEDYKLHKSIFIDPVTEEPLEGLKLWPEFRDEFLADWKSNRRVVTEKEADVHFDKIADESLSELQTIGATDVAALADVFAAAQEDVEPVLPPSDTVIPVPGIPTNAAVELISTPKRRGRPPGSGKKASVAKPATKRIAAKKGGSASAKAEALIERYQARKWSRKDIIEKLVSQLEMGTAYASTLYQKFAK